MPASVIKCVGIDGSASVFWKTVAMLRSQQGHRARVDSVGPDRDKRRMPRHCNPILPNLIGN